MEGLFIIGIPLLIPGLLALAVLVFALALYGWMRQRKIDSETERMESYHLSPEDELKTLGIVAVRTLEEQNAGVPAREKDAADPGDMVRPPFRTKPPPTQSEHSSTTPNDAVEEVRSVETVPRFAPGKSSAGVAGDGAGAMHRHPGTYLNQGSPLWASSGKADAVAFLLESLWAAMHAQSVALLRFDHGTSAYGVDALVSDRVAGQIGLFPTGRNVLDLVEDDESISILEPGAFNGLRYHADPMISVGHAVAIAVHNAADRVILVADVEAGADQFSAKSLDYFGDYGDLLSALIPKAEVGESESKARPRVAIEQHRAKLADKIVGTLASHTEDEPVHARMVRAAESAAEENPETNGTDTLEEATNPKESVAVAGTMESDPVRPSGAYRPRNEIIAEEMAAARQVQEPLALALVVPLDAVDIATQGARAIADAEEQLMERLRDVAGSARVELFGELVAGVFCKAGPAFVEAWVERVESSGPSVQIGVALLRARHRTPESFRADAETALHQAYARQEDCVILD